MLGEVRFWERSLKTLGEAPDGRLKWDLPLAYAICIGARSHIDRCYLVPQSRDSSVDARGNANNWAYQDMPNLIPVSVERPYVGKVKGPFGILYPYSCMVAVETTPQRGTPGTPNGNAADLFGTGVDKPAIFAGLQLQAYTDCMPPWLPRQRAPLEYACRLANFGDTGLSTKNIDFPTYGRKRWSLSLSMSGRSAGAVTWSMKGINHAELTSGTTLETLHTLQPATIESADFDRTYFFDGEFDMAFLEFAESSALNAGVTCEIVFKAWD